ncbi:MAG: hypothetical protein NT076_05900 [Candidatus Pacearchaeota archaeon]|nr:hypothetical protein [Candidatus Pacearchaeota archaeon]
MSSYNIFGKKAKREEFDKLVEKLKVVAGSRENKVIKRQNRPGGRNESGIETRDKATMKRKKFEIVRVGWANETDYNINAI